MNWQEPRRNFINLWVFPILFPSFPITFPIIFPLYPHNFTVSYSFLSHSKYSHKKKREEIRGNTRKLSLYLLGSQDFSVCCPMRWEIEREKEEMRRNKRTGSGDKKREKEVVGECGKLPFWEWVKLPYDTQNPKSRCSATAFAFLNCWMITDW